MQKLSLGFGTEVTGKTTLNEGHFSDFLNIKAVSSFFPHFILHVSFSSPPTLPSLFPATRHSSHPPPHLPPHPHRHTSGFRKGKGRGLQWPVKNAHTHHTTHTHTQHTRALLPLPFKYRRISYSVARLWRGVYCKAEASNISNCSYNMTTSSNKLTVTSIALAHPIVTGFADRTPRSG